jgi:hypothetical protein
VTYPYVKCAAHLPAPGYAVCRHVPEGARVAYHEAPTLTAVGQMICEACWEKPAPHDSGDVRIACASCARQWVPS